MKKVYVDGTEWCPTCSGLGCMSCFDGYLPSRQEVVMDEESLVLFVHPGLGNFWPSQEEFPSYARKEVRNFGEFFAMVS